MSASSTQGHNPSIEGCQQSGFACLRPPLMSNVMKIVPYQSAAGIAFGSSEAEATSALGKPLARKVDSLEQVELRYEGAIFRFSPNERRLVEVTLSSECFEITGCVLPPKASGEVGFVELGYVIAKLDPASFSSVGFIVSPAFGLALDPNHAPHLTAFARSELASWTAIRDRHLESECGESLSPSVPQ